MTVSLDCPLKYCVQKSQSMYLVSVQQPWVDLRGVGAADWPPLWWCPSWRRLPCWRDPPCRRPPQDPRDCGSTAAPTAPNPLLSPRRAYQLSGPGPLAPRSGPPSSWLAFGRRGLLAGPVHAFHGAGPGFRTVVPR
jgi:hypothetical protein